MSKIIYANFITTCADKVNCNSIHAVYKTDDDANVGDIFAVFNGVELAFIKAVRVCEDFEYIKAETGVELDDITKVLSKIDTTAYFADIEKTNKLNRLKTALKERQEEAKALKEANDATKGLKSEAISSLLEKIKEVESGKDEAVAD